MTRILFLLLAVTAVAAEPPKTSRPPSPIAPSLPGLTKAEEEKIDDVINRFIHSDIGKLRGPAASAAKKEFDKLGPEAIPALIRGLNLSAQRGYSCPVLMISQKLNRVLMASTDAALLEFARDEIGAGLGRSKYSGTLEDLRVKCLLRKNALARLRPTPTQPAMPRSTAELAKAASTERGPRLEGILRELARRDGEEALGGLAVAAGSYDEKTQKLGRQLLDNHLARQSAPALKERFDDDVPEVRKSAIRVATSKQPSLVPKVIERLTDADAGVRAEARQALRKISKGEDFGPEPDATPEQQREAQGRWQAWWERVRR